MGFLSKTKQKLWGGVFLGYKLDDAYAKRFQTKYFLSGVEVVFYRGGGGISFGSSLQGTENITTLQAYLGETADRLISEQVSEDQHHQNIKLSGKAYHVHNFKLFDAEGQPAGGLLVFIPLRSLSVGVMVGAFFTIIFFLCILLFRFRKINITPPHLHTNVYEVILSIIFFVVVVMLVSLLFERRLIQIKPSPYTIYNSTLALKPEIAIVERHAETRIAIVTDTGGESINTAQAIIAYNPIQIKVKEIITENSFCDPAFFIEKTIDVELGRVTVVCGVPKEGFTGRNGIIAELVIEPISVGNFILHFEPETQVLAHDGLGTNVLRLTTDGSYQTIDDANNTELETAISSRIYSPTNPNTERWYATREVSFYWNKRSEDRYRYAFNQEPNYSPGLEIPYSTNNSAQFSVSKDGAYYFHIITERNGSLGTVIHRKVKIDNTPPPSPLIQMSNTYVPVGEIVRFEFKNNDEPPSYKKGFYISFDGGIFLPVLPQLNIPFFEKGTYTITLKVFDNAGNSSESTSHLTATKK